MDYGIGTVIAMILLMVCLIAFILFVLDYFGIIDLGASKGTVKTVATMLPVIALAVAGLLVIGASPVVGAVLLIGAALLGLATVYYLVQSNKSKKEDKQGSESLVPSGFGIGDPTT